MPDNELDRILSGEPEIQASPMFAAKVMRAVEREAAALPPIAFPWKRAVPGLALALLAVVYVLLRSAPAPASTEIPVAWVDSARQLGLGWLAAAFAITAAALALTKRLCRGDAP